MKSTTLNDTDRATVNALCALMMEMNNRSDANAYGRGTYGHLSAAIVSFVKNQTGIDISNGGGKYGWNIGGNHSFADDIQAVIDYELAESICNHASANDADPVTDRAGDVALLRRHYDDDGAETVRQWPDPCDFHAPATWHAMTPEQAAAAAI
jgi:hypothetical protein